MKLLSPFLLVLLMTVVASARPDASGRITTSYSPIRPSGNHTVNHTVRLQLTDLPLDIRETPFREVRVLDNRYASTLMDVEGDGNSAPVYTFGEPLAAAVQSHLSGAIASLRQGDKSLLIDINEFRMPCKGISPDITVMMWADAYYQTGPDSWRRIVRVQYVHPTTVGMRFKPRKGDIENGITHMLDRLLAAAGNIGGSAAPAILDKRFNGYLPFEKNYFFYATDSETVSFAQINRPVQEKWTIFPIMAPEQPTDGSYARFRDFRVNHEKADSLRLEFSGKDSVYHIANWDKNARKSYYRRCPWAIAYKGEYYVSFFAHNDYLKLERRDGSFYFYIPHTLPDLPAVKEISRVWGRTFNNTATGEAALLGVALEITILFPMNAIAAHKKRMQGLPRNFRTCYLDMGNGDILCRP